MGGPLSQFAFALCQPGAEARLKEEIRRLRPTYQAAFQRPGLVTFKAPSVEVSPAEAPAAMFARAWGCSGGLARLPEEALAAAARIGATRVFIGPRVPGETVAEDWRRVADVGEARGPVKRGELVLDVVVQGDEPALLGWHVHGHSRHVTPSGVFEFVVPETAPSRAYGKAVEGLAWSGAPVQPGDLLLEIGAAPGGTTLAYLERGLRVLAVDTLELAPVVRAHPGLVGWIQRSIGDVTLEELPPEVRWIAVDAGIAPSRMVRALRRLTLHYRRTLRGMLLTLKLNDAAAVATLPGLMEELGRGGARVDAIQLPTHRNDLLVWVDCARASRPEPQGRSRSLARAAKSSSP